MTATMGEQVWPPGAWFETDWPKPVRDLADEDLASRLKAVEREHRLAEAQLAELIHEADRRQAYTADGHRSVKGWCRAATLWPSARTSAMIRMSRLLARFPAVAETLALGEIGTAQVHELARAFANPRCGDQLAEVLDILVGHSAKLSFEEFRQVVRRWETLADADGAHRDHERSHTGRRAHVHTDDTGFILDAAGGTEQGAEMVEIFEHYRDAEFQADWAHAVAEHGDDAHPDLMPRTNAQRAFDALHRIFVDAASTPADAQAPQPVLNILADVATYQLLLAELLGGSGDHLLERPTDPRWWRHETSSGTIVPATAIINAMIRGHVRRIIIDGAGTIVDVGRKQRLFTGPMRDAILTMSNWCTHPGCDRPSRDCQTDHTVDHQYGGETSTANAGLQCPHHNRIKNRGYAVWRDPNGYWHTYRPDGTEITAL